MTDQTPEFIDPKEYPDFWEQMKNFKEFATSVGQNVVEGDGIFVSEQKINDREKICNDCSQFNRESKKCYLCGCYMLVKWKFKAASCPIELW
jgi:hypothetical protein